VQSAGSTLFMGVLSAVQVLLHRYTGQDDITVGSPLAGRDHADLAGQLGFYVNTVALRGRVSGDMDFLSVLGEARRVTLEAQEHQGYPFDSLVEELDLERDMSRSALFDVMVVLQNNDGVDLTDAASGTGLGISAVDTAEGGASKFDLIFIGTETAVGLDLEIEYNSDLYEHSSIER
ncbi:condensation domain-containing protein, partial [Sphingobacterium siyangense]